MVKRSKGQSHVCLIMPPIRAIDWSIGAADGRDVLCDDNLLLLLLMFLSINFMLHLLMKITTIIMQLI